MTEATPIPKLWVVGNIYLDFLSFNSSKIYYYFYAQKKYLERNILQL